MSIKETFDSTVNFLNDKKQKLEEKMGIANVVKTAGGIIMGFGAIALMLASKMVDDYAVPDSYYDSPDDEDVVDITDSVEIISDDE